MVCRVSNLTLSKESGLPSVFQNTLGKGVLFAECFWELHSAKLFSKEKNNFFLSIPLLFAECFWNYTRQTFFPKKKIFFYYTRQTYFPKKKNIFFSAYTTVPADVHMPSPVCQIILRKHKQEAPKGI